MIPTEIKNFIGREKELAILKKSWQLVSSENKAKFILIQGDFGSGKTVLVTKFLHDLGKEKALIGTAQCALESKDNGLVPFVQLIESISKQTKKIQTSFSGMVGLIAEIAPAWIDVFTAGAATNIAEATSKTVKAGTNLYSGSKITLDNIFVQFTNFLKHITKNRPTAIFIDDIHWADTSSLGLIFHLSRYLQDRSILFILTFRPVEGLETGANTKNLREIRANLIRYGALELDITEGLDVSKYINSRYPNNKFHPQIIEKIKKQSDGHALYISQLFTWWEETEVIIKQEETWLVKDNLKLAIPFSISEVLDERIQLMEKTLRDALMIASVQGDDFAAQIISNLNNIDDYEIYNLLDLLEKRYKLVKEDHKEELGTKILDFYRFLHRFFREHVYKKLNSGQRRLLHKKVGDYLEALHENNLPQISGQLARHYYEANEQKKAIKYSTIAAKHEGLRFAWNESQEWCKLGLSIIDSNSFFSNIHDHYQLLYQMGYAHYRLGNWIHAQDCLQRALKIAEKNNIDIRQQIEINTLLVEVAENENNLLMASEHVRVSKSLLSSFTSDAPPDLFLMVQLADAIVKIWSGQNIDAVNILSIAIDKIKKEDLGDELNYKMAVAYNYLATALSNLDDYEGTAIAFKKMISLAQKIGDKSLEALGLTTLIEDETFQGKTLENLTLINKAIDLARTVGDRETESYALSIRGHLFLTAGHLTESIESLNLSLEICKDIQTEWNMALIYSDLAKCYLKLGKIQEAEKYSLDAVDYGRKSYRYLLGISLDIRAQVNIALSKHAEAEENFKESIIVFEESGDTHLAASVCLNYAEMLINQKKKVESLSILDKASLFINTLKLNDEMEKVEKLRKKIYEFESGDTI